MNPSNPAKTTGNRSPVPISPLTVYLILRFSAALFFSLIFTVNMVYQVTVVELRPLQLVLMGTVLEATVFIFEVPTGVLADVKSRRLSIIIGYALMGAGFMVEGSLPFFWSVALAQVMWGFGYTFTSGATQAWIVDEIGQERAGEAFLRGAQAGRIGNLVAIPISVALGRLDVALPILVGGGLLVALALFLAATMTEEGFNPTPPEDRTTWGMMAKTVRDARALVSRQPLLLSLLGIGLFYGLYSEGLDRLWTPHLLQNFELPGLESLGAVAWFGLIRAVSLVLGLGATELARRRLDVQRSDILGRVLTFNAGLTVLALAGFGLIRNVWLALGLFWLVGALRSLGTPLQATWYNQRIDDPQVRATMFSVISQVDAVGQIAGGPAVGVVGNFSMRWALLASAGLLSPVLPLYALALRRDEREGMVRET